MMTTNKPIETTKLQSTKMLTRHCDGQIHSTAVDLIERGASIEMVTDRFLTFTAAQLVAFAGQAQTADLLRAAADQVEAGVFSKSRTGKAH